MEFLEPSITRKIEELVRETELRHENDYKYFDELLSSLKETVPKEMHGKIAEIESMYIQRVEDIEPVYRTGFDDCSKLISCILSYKAD
jgi:hypothetical protein